MGDLTKHYLISGRVQGVGYRAFAQKMARELGVKGWVRNLGDGRVEAVASASYEVLREFESRLRAGPAHGEVETVLASTWAIPTATATKEFEVRKDGDQPCSEN